MDGADIVGNGPEDLGRFDLGSGMRAVRRRWREAGIGTVAALTLAGGVAGVAYLAGPSIDGLSPAAALAGAKTSLGTQRYVRLDATFAPGSADSDGLLGKETVRVDVDLQKSSVDAVVGIAGKQIEERVIPPTAYLKLPPDLAGISGLGDTGKPWVSSPTSNLTEDGDDDLTAASVAGSVDGLAALTGVKDVGHATVGGRQTRHFRGTAKLSDVGDFFGDSGSSDSGSGDSGSGDGTATTSADDAPVTVDAYIGEDGFARRIVVSGLLDGEDAGSAPDVATVDYTYGVAVTVVAPPADQVSSEGFYSTTD